MSRPTFYSERKENKKIRITPTGWKGLSILAESLDLSISELLEKIGRGAIAENSQFKEFQKFFKKGVDKTSNDPA